MLKNILDISELKGLARVKAIAYETKSVHPKLVEEEQLAGWELDKHHKKTVRLKRRKPHGVILEDRVWSLLYRMGFPLLSGVGGGKLDLNNELESPTTQIDVVGMDNEVALAIECKSSEAYRKRPKFQEEMGKHALIRERFINSVNSQYPVGHKRQPVLVMFISKILLSDNDRQRANDANIQLFDDNDLSYYESLVYHLGPAAKYQFLADLLPGKNIEGLSIRIPAVKTTIGSYNCYAFAISPEYLLKISYISHRSKGKASDVDTYQRMINKSRLKSIKDYISNDGIFPTNIVVNLEDKRLNFERIHQKTEKETQEISGVLGWLDIKPTYKSAWIIDGQHRLYAYSGHERAQGSHLSVLAFEGLLPSKQAELFIDINAKQKSVSKSLLQELYSELHWDSDDPKVRIRAIVSRAIQIMNSDHESPLYQRILLTDSQKSSTRCISINSIFTSVDKAEFYISKQKHGKVIDFGPLWAGDNDATLKRTIYIINKWLSTISNKAIDWWLVGSGEGGGLAMNEGIIACLNVLQSVFKHLELCGLKPVQFENDELFNSVEKYAEELGDFLSTYNKEERKLFRDLRGIQGQTTRRRRCEKAINQTYPDFNPPGLQTFLEQEHAQTNNRAKEITDWIETTTQKIVLEELQREYGANNDTWWFNGVPSSIRQKVSLRFEEDKGQRGGKEFYFDLLDYRTIVKENWRLFEQILGYGKKGSKDIRSAWMQDVNKVRNLVAHPSSGVSISLEQLNELQILKEWLNNAIDYGLSSL